MAWGTKALHNFQNNDRLIILFRRLKFADTWRWHMNVDIRARTRHYLWTNWQSVNVQIKPTCRNDFCSSLNFFDDALIRENKSGHFVLLKWNIYLCSDSHPLALTRAAFEISITNSWRYSFKYSESIQIIIIFSLDNPQLYGNILHFVLDLLLTNIVQIMNVHMNVCIMIAHVVPAPGRKSWRTRRDQKSCKGQ